MSLDRRALLVFGICAAPRLLALAVWPGRTTSYDELATELLTNGTLGFNGVPSTYMEPLYPAFLAAARFLTRDSATGAMLLQVALAAAGGVLLYRLASDLAGPRAGFCACIFYATYPYLIRQSVARLDVTLCTTLAIAATLVLVRTTRRRDAVGSGALFGLLMLTRTSLVVATVAAGWWLAWRGRGRLAAILLITALAVETPWLVRNTRLDGAPLPSRLGGNLYVSTSAYAAALPVHDVDLLVPLALEEAGADVGRMQPAPAHVERAMDDAMLARALTFMREHPGRVLWLKARNALYLFSPLLLPRDAKARGAFAAMDGDTVRVVAPRRPWIEELSHGVAQGTLLVLAGIGLARRRPSARDAPLLLMLGAQAAVCIAFFPTTRFMAPVMFVVLFYAAVGVTGSSAAEPPRR